MSDKNEAGEESHASSSEEGWSAFDQQTQRPGALPRRQRRSGTAQEADGARPKIPTRRPGGSGTSAGAASNAPRATAGDSGPPSAAAHPVADPEAAAKAAGIPWARAPWATGAEAAPGDGATGRGAGRSLEETALKRLRERGTGPAAPVGGAPAAEQAGPKRTGPKKAFPGQAVPGKAGPGEAGSQRAVPRGAVAGAGAKGAGTGPVSRLIQAGRAPKRWIPVAAAVAVVAVALPLALKAGDSSDHSSSNVSENLPLSSGGYEDGSAVGDKDPKSPSPSASKSGTAPSSSPGAAEDGRKTVEDGKTTEEGGTDGGKRKDGESGGEQGETSRGKTAEGSADAADDDGEDASGTASGSGSGWEGVARVIISDRARTCLAVGAERAVVLGTCDPGNAWERMTTDDGSFLLRHASGNWCLDSGGEGMYVSPCTTADSGQLWRTAPADGCSVGLTSPHFGTWVTAWNTGSVGLGTASASSDAPVKRAWTISPSLAGGC